MVVMLRRLLRRRLLGGVVFVDGPPAIIDGERRAYHDTRYDRCTRCGADEDLRWGLCFGCGLGSEEQRG